MLRHFLVCDPSKVKWCTVCRVHSSISDRDMKSHKASAHPCHLKFFKIFEIVKIAPNPNECVNQVISV